MNAAISLSSKMSGTGALGRLGVGLLTCVMIAVPAVAQTTPEAVESAPAKALVPTQARKTSPYHPGNVPASATSYYQSVWGVDNLLVRLLAQSRNVPFLQSRNVPC